MPAPPRAAARLLLAGSLAGMAGDAAAQEPVPAPQTPAEPAVWERSRSHGRLESHPEFPSRALGVRQVDVWLPPGYDAEPERRYPVVYWHDGQNVFRPETSYLGVAWEVDAAQVEGLRTGALPPAIHVGVWNRGELRVREYTPAVGEQAGGDAWRRDFVERFGGLPLSREYVRFLVEELKPFVDREYRTDPRRESTATAGSSMGGLISLFAALEAPTTFGAAACVSTHWPIGEEPLLDWLDAAWAEAGDARPRLWFDYGTEALDAQYEPWQRRVDRILREHGAPAGEAWTTRRYEGEDHSERSWQKRVPEILGFLLGAPPAEDG